MQIRPTNHIQTAQAVNLQPQNTTTAASGTTSAPVDQLDISFEAQSLSGTEMTSTDIRADRISDIKLQIANGQYDTAERLEAAVSRMLNEFA